MYISTPPSSEVENFQMKIYYPAGNRTPDLLNQRQTWYHLSQRGELDKYYIKLKMVKLNQTVQHSASSVNRLRENTVWQISSDCTHSKTLNNSPKTNWFRYSFIRTHCSIFQKHCDSRDHWSEYIPAIFMLYCSPSYFFSIESNDIALIIYGCLFCWNASLPGMFNVHINIHYLNAPITWTKTGIHLSYH